MDKELLRITIIAIGLLIILGMLLWGYVKTQNIPEKRTTQRDFAGPTKAKWDDDLEEPTPAVTTYPEPNYSVAEESMLDYRSAHPPEVPVKPARKPPTKPSKPAPAVHHSQLPKLIQLSIVAKNNTGFNGVQLDEVFTAVGLEYGSMQVYERLEANRKVNYAVASMVKPGIFPLGHLGSFYTPGVTFFMQPQELPDPVQVFEDLLRIIDLIAQELNGEVWDAEHKKLTEPMLRQLRKSLQLT